jgi:Na+-driven multidrug efflux pump
MYAGIAGTSLHLILAYILAVIYDMGMWGIGIASCCHHITKFIVVITYAYNCKKFDEGKVSIKDPEVY